MQLTESSSPMNSMATIPIDELNGEKKLQKSDVISFNDAIWLNFGQDCTDRNLPHYGKAMMLMGIIKERGISSVAFQQMTKDFVASHKYNTWKIADVLEYYHPAALHNEDWYKKQLATTEFNPEHFEVFLVDDVKYYCYKADADKVKLSSRVTLYRPKMIPKVVEPEEEFVETRTSDEQKIADLTMENFELKAEVERIKLALMRKEK